MRFGFREGMENYGDIAKDQSEARRRAEEEKHGGATAAVEGDLARLDEVLSWHAEKRARKTGTSVETQYEVFDLQKEKQEVMTRLKRELAALDDPEAEEAGPSGAREIAYRDGKLLWKAGGGKEVEVTMGEIVTDGIWGVEYRPDPESVPRIMRKRILIERARREIEDLLDEQILAEEIDSTRTHEFTREAYEAIRARRKSGEMPYGIVAERMTAQFVRKKIIDEDQPYKYANADVFQDVQQKIDFIIRRADRGRGVRVEEGGDEIGAKGVQLTLQRDPTVLRRKQAQIERSKERLVEQDRIDDIALVTMDMRMIGRAYEEWKKTKPPGGPDKFLPAEMRERLFSELTSGMDAETR